MSTLFIVADIVIKIKKVLKTGYKEKGTLRIDTGCVELQLLKQ